ncbi:hypothetical protein GCM10027020_05890 [Nocardioides salsibiostraticola]
MNQESTHPSSVGQLQTPRRWRRVTAVATSLALVSLATAAFAGTTDFEGFTAGSVNGQGGWTVEDEFGKGRAAALPPFDEEVVIDGDNTVWRVSNAVTASSFSLQPFSPVAPQVAGESGANLYNDRGDDYTKPTVPPTGQDATSNLFRSGFTFRSATGGPQPGLTMDLAPSAKQSSNRMSLLELTDSGSGFDLVFYERGPAKEYVPTLVATNLSYTDVHSVDLYMEFNDGRNGDETGNDVVHVLVNGDLEYTGTTWESYWANTAVQGVPAPRIQAVDSLLIRLAGVPQTAFEGGGVYFDDVVIDNTALVTASPSPATKDDCKKGGWESYGFSNQGQCIRFVNTGQDSR